MFLQNYWIHFCFVTALTNQVFNQGTPGIYQILSSCHKMESTFDSCIQKAFNDLRSLFKTGIPDYNIKPFDPHRISYVEAQRGNFKLILRNVSEYGWSNSEVTKYNTDSNNNKIIYSQYFPEKYLEGSYEFTAKVFGTDINNTGIWNLTLYDYSQTTSVTRLGPPGSMLRVRVAVDKIGGMTIHISDFFGKRHLLNNFSNIVINSMWKLGLPFFTPLINELVSTAFTEIFNQSFQHFPIDDFIKD